MGPFDSSIGEPAARRSPPRYCGAGMVAGVSKERIASAGHVAGVDLCPETFAIARAVALDIDWREGDVSHLPLRDGELGRRCRLPTGQACSGSRDAASVVKGGRSTVATSRADDEIPLMRELRRVAERRLPRSVGQDRLRGRERARCGTLRRWLAERDRAGAGSTGVRPVMAHSFHARHKPGRAATSPIPAVN